ncbi:hypothetical protein ABK040_007359 [Willaertia magna]
MQKVEDGTVSSTNNDKEIKLKEKLNPQSGFEGSLSESKPNNNKEKRKRKKRKKKKTVLPSALQLNRNDNNENINFNNVEYYNPIEELEQILPEQEVADEFKRIFERFGNFQEALQKQEKENKKEDNKEEQEEHVHDEKKETKDLFELSDDEVEREIKKQKNFEEEADNEEGNEFDPSSLIANKKGKKKNKLKKKKKRKYQLTISQLKQLVNRPDVVEIHDVTANDPRLLVYLKAYKNTVPVPVHWSQKRKYLQGKRGYVKPPFKLPDYIAKTGIQKMREAYEEKESEKTMKQKMRERVRPKIGKMDIDYQVLYDCFFKYQTKPDNLTIHGDLYYEGKEFEQRRKFSTKYKPGKPLSERLRLALGMPLNAPPPWLIKMQEHGPPPSYPNLRIPGLNAPIPEGASYGYHPGGWGRLPVDHLNRPLYNRFFGSNAKDIDEEKRKDDLRAKNVRLWGEEMIIEEEEEEEKPEEEKEEEEDSTEEEDEEHVNKNTIINSEDLEDANIISVTGLMTPKPSDLTSKPTSGSTSSPVPLRPENVNLRKSTEPKVLYRVLEEEKRQIGANELMGSNYQYKISSSSSNNNNNASSSDILMKNPTSKKQQQQQQEKDDKKRKRKDQKDKQKKFKF